MRTGPPEVNAAPDSRHGRAPIRSTLSRCAYTHAIAIGRNLPIWFGPWHRIEAGSASLTTLLAKSGGGAAFDDVLTGIAGSGCLLGKSDSFMAEGTH
jgi:hypothetical protein